MKLAQLNINRRWAVVVYRNWGGLQLLRYHGGRSFDFHLGWLSVYRWQP